MYITRDTKQCRHNSCLASSVPHQSIHKISARISVLKPYSTAVDNTATTVPFVVTLVIATPIVSIVTLLFGRLQVQTALAVHVCESDILAFQLLVLITQPFDILAIGIATADSVTCRFFVCAWHCWQHRAFMSQRYIKKFHRLGYTLTQLVLHWSPARECIYKKCMFKQVTTRVAFSKKKLRFQMNNYVFGQQCLGVNKQTTQRTEQPTTE